MTKILKDQSNRLWKDNTGKILRTQDFNTQVLQSGLSFWGIADANYMTLVGGKISELYDFRDPSKTGATYGKMVQYTDINRPIFQNNGIYVSSTNGLKLTSPSTTTRSLFIVSKRLTGSPNDCCLGTAGDNGIRNSGLFSSGLGTMYTNTTKHSTSFSSIVEILYVAGSVSDFNAVSATLSIYNTNGSGYVYEFGWYNRLLSEQEVLYNQQALMQKYNIV